MSADRHREADDGSVAVAGARLVPAESYAAAVALFQRGSRARTVGAALSLIDLKRENHLRPVLAVASTQSPRVLCVTVSSLLGHTMLPGSGQC